MININCFPPKIEITDIIYSDRIITYLTLFLLFSLFVGLIIKNSKKHKTKPALLRKKTELRFVAVVGVLIIGWLLISYVAYQLYQCPF